MKIAPLAPLHQIGWISLLVDAIYIPTESPLLSYTPSTCRIRAHLHLDAAPAPGSNIRPVKPRRLPSHSTTPRPAAGASHTRRLLDTLSQVTSAAQSEAH